MRLGASHCTGLRDEDFTGERKSPRWGRCRDHGAIGGARRTHFALLVADSGWVASLFESTRVVGSR